ncbi:hypothetical protein JD844_024923, partial [Phrynosoma platyrhinos]
IWTHEVPTLSNDNIALFYGKAVTFQDCFILDTPFVIAQPILHLGVPARTTITSPPGSLASVTWAACFPFTGVLVTDFGVFYTSDAFLTSKEIKIPSNIIDMAIINDVKDVAIAFPDVFILIKDVLYKAGENEMIRLGSNYSVPDSDIIGIQAKTWCSAEYPLLDRQLSEVLIWTEEEIVRGFLNNEFYPLADTGVIKETLNLRRDLDIIIVNYSGNTLIKLNNNALYFFKFEMKDVVKLAAWETRTTHFVFYWKPSGDIYLLKIDARTIDRQIYPLKLEVFSAAWKLGEVCPYISFEHNMNQNIYYLDMGDKVAFWAQIVFLENLGLSVNTEVFNSHLLKQETYLHYEIARGICTKNQTVTFYHAADYSTAFDYESVVKPSECGNITFTVPGSSLRNGEKDLEITYNVEEYGCPIEIDYRATFRPTVLLYMNDKSVATVEANYVLWEVNDRIDFDYNSTMEQVRCLTTAQSWDQMIGNTSETSSLNPSEIDLLWGPHFLQLEYAVCCPYIRNNKKADKYHGSDHESKSKHTSKRRHHDNKGSPSGAENPSKKSHSSSPHEDQKSDTQSASKPSKKKEPSAALGANPNRVTTTALVRVPATSLFSPPILQHTVGSTQGFPISLQIIHVDLGSESKGKICDEIPILMPKPEHLVLTARARDLHSMFPPPQHSTTQAYQDAFSVHKSDDESLFEDYPDFMIDEVSGQYYLPVDLNSLHHSRHCYFRYVNTFRKFNFIDPLMPDDQDVNTTESADDDGKEI